jgi:hypothetical protein
MVFLLAFSLFFFFFNIRTSLIRIWGFVGEAEADDEEEDEQEPDHWEVEAIRQVRRGVVRRPRCLPELPS